MTTLDTIIHDNSEISAIAKKLGLIEVRIFKGVAKGTENVLNLLVRLDPENQQAQYTRSRLLEAYLENKYNCSTTVTFDEKLLPFYKNTILAHAVSLFEPERIRQHFNQTDIIFSPLEFPEEDDELNHEQSQASYLEMIKQITAEWDSAHSQAETNEADILANKLNTLDPTSLLLVLHRLSPERKEAIKHALSEPTFKTSSNMDLS